MKTLIEKINDVKKFHDIFKIGISSNPSLINQKEYALRYDLMTEENDEYLYACENEDISLIADSLGDQLYVLFGTILKHGLQDKIEAIFDEIHKSNMSKLDEKGQPIFREDGKVLKSDLYFKPNIKGILNNF